MIIPIYYGRFISLGYLSISQWTKFSCHSNILCDPHSMFCGNLNILHMQPTAGRWKSQKQMMNWYAFIVAHLLLTLSELQFGTGVSNLHEIKITNSMEHSPSWEANISSASQKIPCILWNPKVHYHIHKNPLSVSVLSQFSPVHVSSFYLLKIHFNIILPPMPRSSNGSLSLRIPHQTIYAPFFSSIVPHAPALSFFLIWLPE